MSRVRPQKGSLILVALCFVAVLGLALASFLAVSKQAMTLGHRVYAGDVSHQLAEMGLERGLRAYASDTFSTWTHSDATTATKTFTISSTRYGSSGITATVNLRVDHFRDTNRAVVWSMMPNYAASDYVYYQGVWYNCISAPPAHQAPSNTTYWKGAPEPWNPYANYQVGNIALLGGTAYKCTVANINTTPPNASYWTSSAVAAWNSATAYAVDTVAYSGGVPYRCVTANTNHAPPNSTYWLSAPVIYAEGVAALPDSSTTTIKTQLRALIAPAALFPNALGAQVYTNISSTGTIDSYNSTIGTYASQVGTASTNYSAVIAGGNTGGTAVTVSGANVRGYVAAPSNSATPYAPRWTYSTATLIGPAGSGVDLTRVSRSPYIPQFDVLTVTGGTNLPASEGSGTLLYEGSRTLGTSGATTPSIYNITGTYIGGGWTTSGFYFDDSTDILTINGPVILNVTGSFYINSGRIIISATGSLEVYFTDQLYIGNSTAGAGGIVNQAPSAANPDPKRMLIVGTSSYNSSAYHYYWSARDFVGLIYMPNAYLHLWNSGAAYASTDRYGAFSANNIYFNHVATLHYDTTLRTAGKVGTFIDGPYVVSELRELDDPTERIVLP